MLKEKRNANSSSLRAHKLEDFSYKLSPDFVHIYANHSALGFTNWDMTITLGEINGEEKGKIVINSKSKVVMSLQHAKAFANILVTNIKKYEEEFGEIQMFESTTTANPEPTID